MAPQDWWPGGWWLVLQCAALAAMVRTTWMAARAERPLDAGHVEPVARRISVVVPARNEAGRIAGCLVPLRGAPGELLGRRETAICRATTDGARDVCVADVRAELAAICARRGVAFTLEEVMRAAAAPSHPAWQARWEAAVQALGLPVFRMPSGAGHDAMKLHEIMPQAMLFMRGLNAGISHNPLESITNDDTELVVRAFQHLLDHLET